jgi:hypothetical protein
MGRVRRTSGTPQRVPKWTNAADGPFSAACYGTRAPEGSLGVPSAVYPPST